MRDKFGIAISIIIALSLLYFIAPMDDLMTLFGKKQNVGEINGTAVSYEDFQNEVNNFTTVNEIVTGSSLKNEQQQEQIRNSAWQSFVDKYLFYKNAKAAGIKVGEDEMVDLTSGDGVSPIIAQFFPGEDGSFDQEALMQFIQNIDTDASGRMKTFWNYLQTSVYSQQLYKKYGALFTASDIQNALMAQKAVDETNATFDVEYVMEPFGYGADSTITVTGNEIRKYYADHKEQYRQDESRDIEYVVFEVVPSQEDIAAVGTSVSELYDEFATTDNVKNFLLRNSDRPYSEYWYKDGELKTVNADVDAFVSANRSGTSQVIDADKSFYVARVMATANIPDSAYVKHILFQGNDAEQKAQEVLEQLKGNLGQFSNLAALNSADQNSAADGEIGNIGWMTQTYMIPGLESVITAEVGKPYIVKSSYGHHIVLVSKKSAPVVKKQVAIFQKDVLASKETFNKFYAQANRFATMAAGKYENYQAAVDSTGTYSHPVNKVLESRSTYGTIDNAREVTRWAFDNKEGKVSNIITVNNNYFFVVANKKVNKEGYTPVAEAAQSIRNLLTMQKSGEKKTAEVKEKIAGLTDMEAIAEALGTTVSTQSDVAFGSMGPQGIDPKFVGAASVAEPGKIGVVTGAYGVYVYNVTGRETGAFYTEEDASNLAAQKSQYNSQMILPVMMNDAEVKDYRARYF